MMLHLGVTGLGMVLGWLAGGALRARAVSWRWALALGVASASLGGEARWLAGQNGMWPALAATAVGLVAHLAWLEGLKRQAN